MAATANGMVGVIQRRGSQGVEVTRPMEATEPKPKSVTSSTTNQDAHSPKNHANTSTVAKDAGKAGMVSSNVRKFDGSKFGMRPRYLRYNIHQENCIYIIEEKTGELYCIILN